MPEEDIVRLQWWGLYHDKPKIGTFMLRVKIPSGILAPAKLRAIGEVSNRYGRGDAELTTRQCIQLHWLELSALPDVFADLEAAGHHERRRLRRHRAEHHRLPRVGPRRRRALRRDAGRRERDRRVLRQSRVGEPAAQAQVLDRELRRPLQRARDQLRLARRRRATTAARATPCRSAAVSRRCRASRATSASSCRRRTANEILGAVTTVWSEDLKYRMSRVKARLKFMVDDIGVEGMLERVEAKLGRTLERFELPPIDVAAVGAHRRARAEAGRALVHRRARPARAHRSGDQLIAVADLVESFGGDIRLTRQQNLIVTGVSDVARRRLAQLDELGLPVETNEIWANSIACTGEPHCNFSVGETKQRLRDLVDAPRDDVRRATIAELRLHLDGCPHACAQHWVGDLGFQATTGKDDDGNRISAYDIFVRGSLGPGAGDRQLALPARAERASSSARSRASSAAGSSGAPTARRSRSSSAA